MPPPQQVTILLKEKIQKCNHLMLLLINQVDHDDVADYVGNDDVDVDNDDGG